MYPTLLDLGEWPLFGHVTLPSYFTLIVLGYVLALWIFTRELKRQGTDPDLALDLGLWVMVWGVIGARLLHVFVDGFFWDYVHLCTDPMLVEGRDLLGRPEGELRVAAEQASIAFEAKARMCTESAQCLASQQTGYDVGALCNTDTGLCHPEQDCFRWAKFWAGGLTFYGGFIGATIFALYFATRHRMGMAWAPKMAELKKVGAANTPVIGPVVQFFKYLRKFPQGILMVADTASGPIAIAHAFGRAGCYLAGCCFGSITQGPMGVQFPTGSLAYQLHRKEQIDVLKGQYSEIGEWLSLPVHPTQLYEVGANTLIFVLLFFVLRRRKPFHGFVFAWLLIFYAIARFVLEFFRADLRGEFFGLSTSQLIAIPLLLIGIMLLVRGYKRSKGVIDDGADPPMGKPLEETVHKPVETMWEGEQVAPVSNWPEPLEKILHKIRHGRGPNEATPEKVVEEDTKPDDKDV